MPRYYFHFVGTADDVATDEEGSELPNDLAAMEYAMRIARDLVAELVSEGEPIEDQRIDVNEGTRSVGSARVRDAIKIAPEEGG
jgi:hypothetical protein